MIRQNPDNPLIWYVRSEEDANKEYVVNLRWWECSCTDFNVRRKPLIKQGYPRHVGMCKHQRKVLDKFAFVMIDVLTMMEEEQESNQA